MYNDGPARRASVSVLAKPTSSMKRSASDAEVIGGLTPSEALRAATLNPAKFLGLDKTLGTIELGKIADLVLLDADPLADIRNTQRINAVISNGRLLDRKALNKMLTQAETN
ncbi:MAG: amidohydrolase family protein [Acidobacteriota bacterium]|nr:amidohydrolase family protein [Acidobacteriota bacterium]